MLDEINDLCIPYHKASETGESLAEGPHGEVAVIDNTEMACRASSAITNYSSRMSIVNHDASIIFFCKPNDMRQIDHFARRRENPIGNDKFSGIDRYFRDPPLEVCHVIMIIADDFAEHAFGH